jgi:DNA-binding MarR family transcriptional regulator
MAVKKRSRLSVEELTPVILSFVASKQEATIKEMGEAIGKTTPRASQIVKALLAKKYLKKVGVRTGGRGKNPLLFALSVKGKKVAEKAPAFKAAMKKLPARKKAASGKAVSSISQKVSAPGGTDSKVISQLVEAVNSLATAISSMGSQGVTFSMTFGGLAPAEAPKAKQKKASAKKRSYTKKKAKKEAGVTEGLVARKQAPAKKKVKAPAKKEAAPQKMPAIKEKSVAQNDTHDSTFEPDEGKPAATPVEDIRVELDEGAKTEESRI